MKNALNNQVGMLGDMFLWFVANLKQGVIYFIKQALPPNKSARSVITGWFLIEQINVCFQGTHVPTYAYAHQKNAFCSMNISN